MKEKCNNNKLPEGSSGILIEEKNLIMLKKIIEKPASEMTKYIRLHLHMLCYLYCIGSYAKLYAKSVLGTFVIIFSLCSNDLWDWPTGYPKETSINIMSTMKYEKLTSLANCKKIEMTERNKDCTRIISWFLKLSFYVSRPCLNVVYIVILCWNIWCKLVHEATFYQLKCFLIRYYINWKNIQNWGVLEKLRASMLFRV